MTQIDMRAVSAHDLNVILEIEKQSFSRPWNHTSFLNELACKNAYIFAARYTPAGGLNPIIAYISFRLLDGEMHILKIAVENEWRRRGVASFLLETQLKRVSRRSIYTAFLEVRHSNTVAMAFYDKLGFKCIGRRPNYYSNGNGKEDALLMMKVLKEEI